MTNWKWKKKEKEVEVEFISWRFLYPTCMAICRKSPWSKLDFTVPSSSLLQPTSECGERMMRNSWRSPCGRNSNSIQTGCSWVTTPNRHTTLGCCSSVSTAASFNESQMNNGEKDTSLSYWRNTVCRGSWLSDALHSAFSVSAMKKKNMRSSVTLKAGAGGLPHFLWMESEDHVPNMSCFNPS